eukprot:gene24719-30093_t
MGSAPSNARDSDAAEYPPLHSQSNKRKSSLAVVRPDSYFVGRKTFDNTTAILQRTISKKEKDVEVLTETLSAAQVRETRAFEFMEEVQRELDNLRTLKKSLDMKGDEEDDAPIPHLVMGCKGCDSAARVINYRCEQAIKAELNMMPLKQRIVEEQKKRQDAYEIVEKTKQREVDLRTQVKDLFEEVKQLTEKEAAANERLRQEKAKQARQVSLREETLQNQLRQSEQEKRELQVRLQATEDKLEAAHEQHRKLHSEKEGTLENLNQTKTLHVEHMNKAGGTVARYLKEISELKADNESTRKKLQHTQLLLEVASSAGVVKPSDVWDRGVTVKVPPLPFTYLAALGMMSGLLCVAGYASDTENRLCVAAAARKDLGAVQTELEVPAAEALPFTRRWCLEEVRIAVELRKPVLLAAGAVSTSGERTFEPGDAELATKLVSLVDAETAGTGQAEDLERLKDSSINRGVTEGDLTVTVRGALQGAHLGRNHQLLLKAAVLGSLELLPGGAASLDVNACCADGVSPLAAAAALGQPWLVRALRDLGANDRAGAVVAAAQAGHADTLLVLLPRASPNERNRLGQSALVEAAIGGHLSAVHVMLEAGAHASHCDASERSAAMAAAEGGHLMVLQALLAAGAEMSGMSTNGMTCLMYAAKGGNVTIIEKAKEAADLMVAEAAAMTSPTLPGALEEDSDEEGEPAPIDAADIYGLTAVMHAAMAGKGAAVRWLVRANAGVYSVAKGGRTALMIGVEGGNLEAVRSLLDVVRERGGDLVALMDLADEDGTTALMRSATVGYTAILKVLLEAGADHGAFDMTGALSAGRGAVPPPVVRCGCQMAVTEDAWNALHVAAKVGCAAAVKALLAAGAPLEKRTSSGPEGASALMVWVLQRCDVQTIGVLQYLLDAGADANCITIVEEMQGLGPMVPLDVVQLREGPDEVKKLLEKHGGIRKCNLKVRRQGTPGTAGATADDSEKDDVVLDNEQELKIEEEDSQIGVHRPAAPTEEDEEQKLVMEEASLREALGAATPADLPVEAPGTAMPADLPVEAPGTAMPADLP